MLTAVTRWVSEKNKDKNMILDDPQSQSVTFVLNSSGCVLFVNVICSVKGYVTDGWTGGQVAQTSF